MTEGHPDFIPEKQHLEDTIKEMKKIIDELGQDIEDRSRRIRTSQELKDQISAYVHAMMKNSDANKIWDIESVISSPYFGRVDFREDDAANFESFYIGRAKVMRPKITDVQDILVFDWRDPVSTIFYECQGGRAKYDVLNRYHYSGDVRLKRRYKIKTGVLKMIVDDYNEDRPSGGQQENLFADPILRERLVQGAGEKLKDIITSIQEEQNRIIRESLNQVVLVQGVAGSGKSTVGLHRLSYLLYNEKIDPKRMVIIAPNRIFLDYIGELLPQIDAKDVCQMVWDDLAFGITRQKWQLAEEEKLQFFVNNDPDSVRHRALLLSTAKIKGSLAFRQVLERYIGKKIKKFCLALQDISLFNHELVISRKQQIDKFLADPKAPYNERINTLTRYVRFQVRNFLEVLEAKHHLQKDDPALKVYRQQGDVFLDKYFTKWNHLTLLEGYIGVFKDKSVFKAGKDKKEELEDILRQSLSVLQDGNIDRDDLAPLCYLTYLLDGWGHMNKFDHIVVDEAQDMNALEFSILKMLSSNGSFTILGDLSQGIHSYRSIANWQVLSKEVFADDRTMFHEIRHSYRSAKEIVELFNRVMPSGHSPAIPVYEVGFQPVIEQANSLQDGTRKILAVLRIFQSRGYKTIGIITKSETLSKSLHDSLGQEAGQHHGPAIRLVSGGDASYRGGISVLPIALAKGLEFDAVILWDASAAAFKKEDFDARLLYVALSRAMHGLHILYQQELTPLLL